MILLRRELAFQYNRLNIRPTRRTPASAVLISGVHHVLRGGYMKQREGSTFETLRRAQGFLDANNAVLGEINQSGARTQLDQVVAELSQQAVEQRAGRVNS